MSDLREIPDADAISKASQLEIYDAEGHSVRFGSLFETQRVVAIFVRHFFCGEYIQAIVRADLGPLERANAKVVVIGCGDWKAIKMYAETTGFNGRILADPTRELYQSLGMTIQTIRRTPAGEERKSYLVSSPTAIVLGSVWGIVKNPGLIGKQGNPSQVGGEFVFGPGLKCTFASRMKHTEDHTEVADLIAAVVADS
ncbi:hypothetical protein AX16_010953 [Volvariella volvacea WC 439]|nr:hypothetical protein AX16_010953 [Volvariella volvacea WC 439]